MVISRDNQATDNNYTYFNQQNAKVSLLPLSHCRVLVITALHKIKKFMKLSNTLLIF